MQTLEQELEALKRKLEDLKLKRASSKQISKQKEEIQMYECAISAQNPEKLIKLTKMDIADRKERIKGLKSENEDDEKYINLLRRKIKERQQAQKNETIIQVKQCSIVEHGIHSFLSSGFG